MDPSPTAQLWQKKIDEMLPVVNSKKKFSMKFKYSQDGSHLRETERKKKTKQNKTMFFRETTESKVSTMDHSQCLTKQPQITRYIKKQKMSPSIKRKGNH